MAASIKSGYYSVGLAGGVETMSTNPMAWDGGVNPKVAENQQAQDCLLPMGACCFPALIVCKGPLDWGADRRCRHLAAHRLVGEMEEAVLMAGVGCSGMHLCRSTGRQRLHEELHAHVVEAWDSSSVVRERADVVNCLVLWSASPQPSCC